MKHLCVGGNGLAQVTSFSELTGLITSEEISVVGEVVGKSTWPRKNYLGARTEKERRERDAGSGKKPPSPPLVSCNTAQWDNVG